MPAPPVPAAAGMALAPRIAAAAQIVVVAGRARIPRSIVVRCPFVAAYGVS
jgi:hypothetical protein